MKTWTLRFRVKDKNNFDEVKNGSKEYETRAGTIKYQTIKSGDELVFVCNGEKFSKTIIEKYHWPDIDTMIKEIPFNKIMPSVNSIEEMKKAYASYPDYEEKIEEFGLLGFRLK